jgi:excisionase family DNA binding protein
MENRAGVITTTATAREIGITRQTVGNWIRDGRIVASKVGGTYLILRSEVERLIQEGDLPRARRGKAQVER